MKAERKLAMTSREDMPLRPGVGIMLINRDGLVWAGRRVPKWFGDKSAFIWQMPQGGLDKDEDPQRAALRELYEETNITSVEIVGEIPGWLSYELPDELLGVALKGKYRGQRQRWYAMRFWGDDSEIDISAKPGTKQEFDRWSWRPATQLPDLIVPFKRPLYQKVVNSFNHLTNINGYSELRP